MTKQRREQGEESRRRLRRALLWSCLAHGLVLGIGANVPRWRESAMAGPAGEPSLVARLVRPVAVAPAPSLATERRAHPVPTVHERSAVLTVPDPASAPVAVPPAPTFVPPSAVGDGAASRNTAATQAPLSQSQSQSPASSSVASAFSSADVGGSGLDADALGSYKLRLASQARRFKRYPAEAQSVGWVGTAEIRLAIGRNGQPQAAELGKSSGHEILDRAAMAMIDAAAHRTELPSPLLGQAFTLTLPVEFRLEDR